MGDAKDPYGGIQSSLPNSLTCPPRQRFCLKWKVDLLGILGFLGSRGCKFLMLSRFGAPEGHANTTILQSGSKVEDKGDSRKHYRTSIPKLTGLEPNKESFILKVRILVPSNSPMTNSAETGYRFRSAGRDPREQGEFYSNGPRRDPSVDGFASSQSSSTVRAARITKIIVPDS